MRVFVTGAGGFVGRRLQPRLEAAGHAVIAVDREVDVTREDALRRALARARPEAIIHLAAISSVARSWQHPADCYRVNFLGTRRLLRAVEAEVPTARLLLIGSADEYAATSPRAAPLDETAPLLPRSP